MNHILIITLLFIFSLSSLAQAPITISGQVKDESSSMPLEFCNVSYYSMKDSLISGTATDQKGFYSIDLPMGNYRQIISFVGNVSDTSIVQAFESKFQGTTLLKADMNMLEEASVKASSRSTEIDRDVQVVTKEMKEGTSSAKYVMNKLNGVHYDEYNNSIKVDNDNRVIILVDGIQKDQDYVKNMAPDRLKKIEVIRDPGGRYGMEGYSAVINIILDKNYAGVEVLLQERGLFDADPVKRDYSLVQNSPSATVTYTYNRFSVYGKVLNNRASYNMDQTESKEYGSGLLIEKMPGRDNDVGINVNQNSYDFTLGADYFINPKHTVSFEGKMIKFPSNTNTVDLFQTINTYQDGSLLSSVNSEVGVGSNSFNSYGSVFYEGKLNENNTIKSNLVYSDYKNNQVVSTIGGRVYAQDGTDNKQNTNYYAEYDHTFTDRSNLMIGYGYTYEHLSSDFNSDWQVNDFETFEQRNRFYSYYSRGLTDKLSMKIGAGAETSARRIDDRVDDYFIFLPHVDLKYDIAKMTNIKLKLRSEGSYPTINQTNPFTTFVDFESVQTGNPDLEPGVTNRLSAQLTVMQALTIEPYYHFSNNTIISTGTLVDSVFHYRFDNAGEYNHYGIKTNLTVPFGKSVFFQTSLDFYKSNIEYGQYNNDINDWAMSSQLIYFHQKSKSMAGIIYQKNNNKIITPQGYRHQNVDFWALIARKPFFDEKLTVMMLYFTPLQWGIDPDQVTFIETDSYLEKETTSMNFFKNMIMLEISYRFNKGKVLKKEKEVDYIREKENKAIF